MIRAVAFCPHPPVLVPEVAQGAARELDDVRAAARRAIRRVGAVPGRLVVLGPGPASAVHDARARGSFAGFGVADEVSLGSDEPGPVELPLSLTVGAWLVRDALGSGSGAIGCSVAVGEPPAALPDIGADVTLLVMGDGSARRSVGAPGYLDARAEAFDAGIADALAGGDGSRLRVDESLAGELLASGAPAWNAAAAALGGVRYDAELLYADAPYGVGYFVAAWTLHD